MRIVFARMNLWTLVPWCLRGKSYPNHLLTSSAPSCIRLFTPSSVKTKKQSSPAHLRYAYATALTVNPSSKNVSHTICGISSFDTYQESFEQKRPAQKSALSSHTARPNLLPNPKSAQICVLIRENLREPLLPAPICVNPFFSIPQSPVSAPARPGTCQWPRGRRTARE